MSLGTGFIAKPQDSKHLLKESAEGSYNKVHNLDMMFDCLMDTNDNNNMYIDMKKYQ